MTQYNARRIEEIFTRKAWTRASKKIRGDAGYWDGGRCDYGGAHNLKEDCQTLAKFFDNITELESVRKDLINFNNREEFEINKQNLLFKTNQALDGLNVEAGSSTYIGGVCIIWEEFSDFLNSIVSDFRKEIESLKRDIENTQYEEAQELALIEQRERDLKQEIEENKRKAQSETDPEKKKKFLFLADQAKEEWGKLLEKKKQLKIANLGNNFNPNKHINDFLKSIEDSLNGNTSRKSPFKTPNPLTPNNNPSSGASRNNTPLNPFQPSSNSNQNFFQQNQSLIILGAIAALLILYFYSQPEEENYHNF